MPSAKAEKVNVVEKIKNTIDLYVGTDGVELSFTLHSPSKVMVKADGEQLLRVFNNLIKNAIQAARPGNPIKVDVEVQSVSDKVCVIVRDNGRGVTEEIRDKLFVPSFTTKSGGMGLGLAIVRRIVENAGGDIRYEPNNNGGAVFTVELPVVNYSSDSDE
jgi:signal transduction histidine kinase